MECGGVNGDGIGGNPKEGAIPVPDYLGTHVCNIIHQSLSAIMITVGAEVCAWRDGL